MKIAKLLDELEYSDSPNFLRADSRNSFAEAADFAHIFRRAHEHCNLEGVYTLRHAEPQGRDTIVPVVYVCTATTDEQARSIHRQVWNQNVVPFIIVASPSTIRLYSGFRYESQVSDSSAEFSGALKAANDMDAALRFLEYFRASRIDDGSLWDNWGRHVTPQTRVDWRLLSSLNDLDEWLKKNGISDPDISHSLIGKYVYLHYLHDRNILSNRKLAKWGIEERDLFGRNAKVSAFWKVVDNLDDWLNGSVFPLKSTIRQHVRQEHIRRVAGTFSGDDPASGQLALDFGVYNFSFIPVETLSVIYEQFLHSPTSDGSVSAGEAQGAYYTPVPLVNFMLEELDAIHPFREGMKVLDPACGSGAFLVQCFRRIIEQDEEFEPGKSMRPARLRELLQQHIFGMDRDGDACRVAELSLILTLLDYVDPPDLEGSRFKLPDIHGANIHEGDFFASEDSSRETISNERFDWIVGNPPWIELKRNRISSEDEPVWNWMQKSDHRKDHPIGGNQVAEAFAWKVCAHLQDNGSVALLVPAMTLFKDESTGFRKKFFATLSVHAVANFANLAEVLFPGHRYRQGHLVKIARPRRPAAALFYSRRHRRSNGKSLTVFSPLVAEQVAARPAAAGERQDTWNIVAASNQIGDISVDSVADGSALPWKVAMWGSQLDIRLLRSVATRFENLRKFCDSRGLIHTQGLELRTERSSSEPLDAVPGIAGKMALEMDALRQSGLIFQFPDDALNPISNERCFVRKGRGGDTLRACFPPHIIIDEARRFAVYSDTFIAIPARQIGISGSPSQAALLKALSLYLVSDFAKYHQFLTTPQWGISTSISTLAALRALPIPLSAMTEKELSNWAHLHSQFVDVTRPDREITGPLFSAKRQKGPSLSKLIDELNDRTYKILGIKDFERILVNDLVHIRMRLIQGKVDEEAVRKPSEQEIKKYAELLTNELDAFVDDQPQIHHSTAVVLNDKSAILSIRVHDGKTPNQRIRIVHAEDEVERKLRSIQTRVRRTHSQWIYFERNLRLFDGRDTYLFKPLQRLHWTESQAILDAGTIIAETLS